ncbi:MAG TPA: TlpA disulfide reductase family protein [Bacteroidia bacterium]|jgi:thiol-disulfide isomerase/thioredoxin
MKFKNILLLLPFTLAFACGNTGSSGSDFEIKGQLSNSHGENVYLEQLTQEAVKPLDTAQVNEKGEFTLNAPITETGFYRLKISDKNFATLILEPGQKVTISGDAQDLGNTYTVKGSPDSELFWELNQRSGINYRQRDSLQRIFQAFVNTAKMDSLRIDSVSKQLEKPYTKLVNDHNKYLQEFIEKNSSSFASLAAIQQLPPEEFMQTYIILDRGLYAKYPNSSYIQSFHASVGSQQKLSIGSAAPEILMNTPDEKPLPLSSLQGKVVLVDFWASWCGPCRAENPNVVKAYNKYKSKGFDIYSVSLDKDKDKWIAAIAKDGLTWKSHVSDFMHWQSPVVKLYNFNGIPYNVLLDKKGNIIAKNLRGEDLEKKLEEILK